MSSGSENRPGSYGITVAPGQASQALATIRAEALNQPLTSIGVRSRRGRGPTPAQDEHSEPMPLTPGTRFGPYEIVVSIGAGGMGEVYRARFTREAQILAALNHPNIAAIYGLEEAGGAQFVCSNATSDVTLLREAIQ